MVLISSNINPSGKVVLGAKAPDIKYIAGQMRLTYAQVLALIQQILADTLLATKNDLRDWINKFVPKRTGQLRNSLLENLNSSRVNEGLLRIILGTHINYALDVDAMSTGQVRHSGTMQEHSGKWAYAYYYGHYGRIFLYDPQAVGNFWEKLLAYARQRARVNLLAAKRRYLGFTGGSSPAFKGVKVVP